MTALPGSLRYFLLQSAVANDAGGAAVAQLSAPFTVVLTPGASGGPPSGRAYVADARGRVGGVLPPDVKALLDRGGSIADDDVPDPGMVRLAGGTIEEPLAFIDLELPATYVSFQLYLLGGGCSNDDFITIALSADAGQTFINDATNFDSYMTAFNGCNTVLGSSTPDIEFYNDSLIAFGGDSGDATVKGSSITTGVIFPGDGNNKMASISMNNSASRHIDGTFTPQSIIEIQTLNAVVNPAAMITPPLGRINPIHLLPYGNGDCDPPTSGHTITAGSYVLWGIPS